ncbi:hypothetical protein CROQUDRAFT_132870 [Cronartium quercuum f. sp. fusiforme G11]|uniref:GAR domain-containing protein n=1 Tax=Cronartium quercuum f. sp. fusiforme G11 TaxID=708437 RepID=A0A9P6NJN4_9BASI|nr:hypothetical protein CROQUDRAFT_132870 [Cronartium quercuum f. sp. fusiforme G11]
MLNPTDPPLSPNTNTTTTTFSETTTVIGHSTKMVNQLAHKLDNNLILLLEGLNERKARIDQQAHFLSNLPKILPFEPLPPASSIVSSKTWETWWAEHDRIEREADIFREDEFALMKKVAMSKTTNMSREDTDLVGLTLGTLEAFSKLEHLLRSRRKQLQILDLRIKWDHQCKKVRTQLTELEAEQLKFLSKIRWVPPSAHADGPGSNPSSPLLRQSLSGQIASPVFSQPTASPHTPSQPHPSRKESVSHQHKRQPTASRLSFSSIPPQPDLDLTNSKAIDHTHTPSRSSLCGPEFRTPSPTTHVGPLPTSTGPAFHGHDSSSSLRTTHSSSSSHRASSQPATPTPAPTPPPANLPSSISAQSRAMRIQSLALQLSSLTTKFHTLNRSLLPTSATIDSLIDSGLHLPEAFLDEQDTLEASVRMLESVESLRFYSALLEQYKEADEVWFGQRLLEAEIAELKRELESQLAATRPSKSKLIQLRTKVESFTESQKKNLTRTENFSRFPTHSNLFKDQSACNNLVVEALVGGSERVQARLDQLVDALGRYAAATEAMERAREIRLAMEACKARLGELVEELESLERAHPHRAELLTDPERFEDDEGEVKFGKARMTIERGLGEQLVVGMGLLERNKAVLAELERPGVDPNLRSDTEQIEQSLRTRTEAIENLLAERNRLRERLGNVRGGWRKVTGSEFELVRLRDRILAELDRSKWRKAEEPDASTALEPDSDPVKRMPMRNGFNDDKERSGRLETSTDARQAVEALKPVLDSTLSLLLSPEHDMVHRALVDLYASLIEVKVPELVKLERLRDAIMRQTAELAELETVNESLTLEGSRLMKRIQDQIGVELDRTYEEESGFGGSIEKNMSLERARKKLVGRVSEYLEEVDRFASSLASRVSFVADAGPSASEPVLMGDGQTTVLIPSVHDAGVRSMVNGISMSLLGLRDHLANESALLGWIDGEQARCFERAIEDARKEVRVVIVGLESIERELEGWGQLIDSDRLQPARSDKEIESCVNEPITNLERQMDKIATQISQSTSKALEDFIGACPTAPTSNLFKPDQFILPKQMVHHQLQSLYNATSRRLKSLKAFSDGFINGPNERRRKEFEWRSGWQSALGQCVEECERIKDRSRGLGDDLSRIEGEMKTWEMENFEKTLITDLIEALTLAFPGYLSALEPFKNRISSIDETMTHLQEKIDQVNSRRKQIGQEIQENMPEDDHLINELTNVINQLWPQWLSVQEDVQRLRDLMGRLTADVEKRRAEHALRATWHERCDEMLKEASLDSLLDGLESQLDAHLSQWAHDQANLTCHEGFLASVEALRRLTDYRSHDLSKIDHTVKLIRSKTLTISEEVGRLSQLDLPHPYLSRTQSEVERLALRLVSCVQKIKHGEFELIERIVECNEEMVRVRWVEVEDAVLEDQIEGELTRVRKWNEDELGRFLTEIGQETEQVDRLHSLIEEIERGSQVAMTTSKINAQLNTSTSSNTSSSSRLNEEDSKLKERFVEVKNLIESISKAHVRLSQLDTDQVRLLDDLVLLERTLPPLPLAELRTGLDQTDFISGYQAAELTPLTRLHARLDQITGRVKAMLEGTEKALEVCKQKKARSKAMLRIFDQLAGIDLDRWVNPKTNVKHAPLPTRATRKDMGNALECLREPILKITEDSDSVDEVLLEKLVALYDSQKFKLGRLGDLSEFHEAGQDCDEAFSKLLDALDRAESNDAEAEAELLVCVNKASTSLQVSSEKSCAVATDARVEYQLERLAQTWAELSEMVKDRHSPIVVGSNPRPRDSSESPKSQTASKIPVLNRSSAGARLRTYSMDSAAHLTPPRPSPSKLVPIITTLDHDQESTGTRRQFQDGTNRQVPISTRHSRRTPDLKMAPKHHHEPEAPPPLPVRSRLPSSLMGASMGRVSGLRNRISMHSLNTQSGRPAFGLSTPPSTRIDNSNKKMRYRPQSNRNIEKMVGNVVNRLAVEVHVAPAEGAWEDNSGLYWIGEKIYFCRILRSQTVMVRIGGGWNELSSFLLEHSKQPVSVGVSPQNKLEAGGPERWTTASEVRRASADPQLLVAGNTASVSTPRTRTLSGQTLVTPPEAIQLYLRKAQAGSPFGTPTPPVSSVGTRRHWRP